MCNSNYYNNFIFQMPPTFVPPPPPPPAFFMPPIPHASDISDQDFIKNFENKSHSITCKTRPETISIYNVKEKLQKLVLTLKDISNKHQYLMENKSTLPDEEWNSLMTEIDKNKLEITETLNKINDSYLSNVKVLLTKRSAKRSRLKRINLERKKEKEQKHKELEEISRKINEKLQKTHDDINKTKMEHEAKLQADVILKDVLRKKLDAKKCLSKLEALMKLRKARQNTAKGRGENVLERDAATFNNNIEKLKTLWSEKLVIYEKEESDLRAQLNQDTNDETQSVVKEREILDNLDRWREFIFGDKKTIPQVDFGGGVGQFIAVRSQWDQHLSKDGSSLPVGWVLPHERPD